MKMGKSWKEMVSAEIYASNFHGLGLFAPLTAITNGADKRIFQRTQINILPEMAACAMKTAITVLQAVWTMC